MGLNNLTSRRKKWEYFRQHVVGRWLFLASVIRLGLRRAVLVALYLNQPTWTLQLRHWNTCLFWTEFPACQWDATRNGWVVLVRQKSVIRIDLYTAEVYLCVDIFVTDSLDLSLQNALACSIKQVLVHENGQPHIQQTKLAVFPLV